MYLTKIDKKLKEYSKERQILTFLIRCVKLDIFSFFKIFIKILMKENKEMAPAQVTADVGVVGGRNVEGTIDDSTC